MVDTSDEPPLSSSHSWAKKISVNLLTRKTPTKHPSPSNSGGVLQHVSNTDSSHGLSPDAQTQSLRLQDNSQQAGPVQDKKDEIEEPAAMTVTEDGPVPKAPIHKRFARDVKRIITASWVNVLLIFVPVGIILGALNDWANLSVVSPSVVFALNAVAIIPLASLLAFATESVAVQTSDSIGALLNVTFGNAVEIIVFVLALIANEVRIVQAAALGSILSNLLLILGMSFVLGGLRFREQVYNSSVSQLSAVMLSLSVVSLLLPTAFHAAFTDNQLADRVVLKVSRGTSVVLLLVYILYLVFQLKSHAFFYESTPQHIIDEESHPGVLAQFLDSSSSSSNSSSSDSSDSDTTVSSRKRKSKLRRALRRKSRRSVSSTKDEKPAMIREESNTGDPLQDAVFPVQDGPITSSPSEECAPISKTRDLEPHYTKRKDRRSKKDNEKRDKRAVPAVPEIELNRLDTSESLQSASVRVGFMEQVKVTPAQEIPAKRPSHIRQLSSAIKPALSSTVFPHHQATTRSLAPPYLRPHDRVEGGSARRATSMPDIRREIGSDVRGSALDTVPPALHHDVEAQVVAVVDTSTHLSRTSAIIMLLATTGLVALCAEFLVGSIDYLVSTSGVSQAFIGLIILPIVGNAAEHVTAVTVAYKNKMDLAINIALGSSIQIALFVTPLMVMLGWAIGSEMSLFFSLFETMSLFASAFIVNYLLIDGKSHYFEGILLIAAYVIIAIAAFFYPACGAASQMC